MDAEKVAAVVLALLLAGCATANRPSPEGAVTEAGGAAGSAGTMRGVVIDDAVRPIVGAEVRITGASRVINVTSGESGSFEVAAPLGVHLVLVSKAGYSPLEQAVTVTSDANPEAVKFQLPRDASTSTYATQTNMELFLECSALGVAVCAVPQILLCGVAGQLDVDCPRVREDTTTYFIGAFFTAAGRIPTHVQVEGIWQATQPAGEAINFAMRSASAEEWNSGAYGPFFGNFDQRSPMVARLNATQLNETDVGLSRGLHIGLFSGSNVNLGNPTLSPMTGAAVNQRIDLFITAFYGYVPPADWTWTGTGDLPPPA